jgi:DASS family divalent anion:Na+ symporter
MCRRCCSAGFHAGPDRGGFSRPVRLIITGTIDWDDVLSEKSAWDTLIWFGALVMLAEQLNKLGVVAWFAEGLKNAIVASGLDWLPVAAILVGIFVFSHYLFASTTAHISAMMLAFLTVGATDPSRLRRALHADDDGRLGHHDDADALRDRHSPIIFGSGYVTLVSGGAWGLRCACWSC